MDLPHIDQPENPFMPKDSIEFAPSDPSRRYINREGMYCPESNFDVSTTSVRRLLWGSAETSPVLGYSTQVQLVQQLQEKSCLLYTSPSPRDRG